MANEYAPVNVNPQDPPSFKQGILAIMSVRNPLYFSQNSSQKSFLFVMSDLCQKELVLICYYTIQYNTIQICFILIKTSGDDGLF